MDNIVDMREYDVPYHVRLSIDLKIHVVRDEEMLCFPTAVLGPALLRSHLSRLHRKVKCLMCSPSSCLSPELCLICRALFLVYKQKHSWEQLCSKALPTVLFPGSLVQRAVPRQHLPP